MIWICKILILTLLVVTPGAAQNRIGTALRIELGATSYGVVTRVAISEVGSLTPGVKWKVDRLDLLVGDNPERKNFLVVTPSSGVTPARITIGPNPHVVRTLWPGRYAGWLIFTTVDQTPPSSAVSEVIMDVTAPPPARIDSIVNVASLDASIAPGMLISISGSNLGPPVYSATYDSAGLYPVEWGNTRVAINGVAAPLLSVSPTRILALVPFALAGQGIAEVVLSYFSRHSPAFQAPVTDTSPAIFTASEQGRGPGIFLHYPSNSRNSDSNPAPAGSAVTLFATGEGVWDAAVPDVGISAGSRNFVTRPVSLTVGGLAARVIYAGAAPYQAGVLQVNAILPERTPSGPQPVVLKIGDRDNMQQGVTIAIQ